VARLLESAVGPAIRENRLRLGWSQRDLAREAHVSQSLVSRTERCITDVVSLAEVGQMLDALGVRIDMAFRAPLISGGPAERDAAHAHLIAYAEGRLRRAGLQVAREVPIGSDRVRGWIDLLAWRAPDRLLIVVEVKADIDDLGALERQVSWYEREAWDAARRLGWRPSRVGVVLVALASRRNADFVRRHVDALRRRFPTSPSGLSSMLAGRSAGMPVRALAFVDPRRRVAGWLLPTPVSGGRPVLPYADAADLRSMQSTPMDRSARAVAPQPRAGSSPVR
jgi:transcriptional regulator with XRE-family HTH domain